MAADQGAGGSWRVLGGDRGGAGGRRERHFQAQYLFSTDVLGTNRGHVPRHSKVYRNLAAEYARLQQERIAAFSELVRDIKSGAYPERRHVVDIPKGELDQFLRALEAE
jgi:3-methyl-2-oxobutanoate hydroxymethyltransferase